MKTHLFIGAGETPSERTKKIMDRLVEAGFSVEYEQLASKPKEGSQATILIWDEMEELSAGDLSQLEALYEHPIYVADKQRGKGPRNKWGKIR